MYIDSLSCLNYRNYEKLDISFSKGTNILYGDNAQGKTNILEAIYISGTTKSHRNSKEKDIIRLGESEAHIRANVKKREVGHKIDIHLNKSKPKTMAINGLPIKRAVDLFGFINVIFFSPEDLSIIKNGPNERRKFMNVEISLMNRLYLINLQRYSKILEQRNNLLKQIAFAKKKELLDTLDVWDMQMVQIGQQLIRERGSFISMMNEIIRCIHHTITSGTEDIVIRYEPAVTEDNFETMLKQKRETDIKYASSQIGPHRDDFGVYINDRDVRTFGSQGQQRTSALSLKLAEIELVKKVMNDKPILLLDDVLSELDSKRQDALLSGINDIQAIITCTGYDDFISQRMAKDKLFRVEAGQVFEQ